MVFSFALSFINKVSISFSSLFLFVDLFNRIICHILFDERARHIVLMREYRCLLEIASLTRTKHCYLVNVTSWNSRRSLTSMTNAFFKWWRKKWQGLFNNLRCCSDGFNVMPEWVIVLLSFYSILLPNSFICIHQMYVC